MKTCMQHEIKHSGTATLHAETCHMHCCSTAMQSAKSSGMGEPLGAQAA